MGLSNPRKRAKISSDPNNTAWSRSSTLYGRKILQSQGWAPGSALGANSELQLLSNSSASTNIKVVLKDDNLGLGAKGLQHDQCTGLDAFQGLLDSLNGKAKGQASRQEQIYQGKKPAVYEGLGKKGIRFVSGGFLKGREQEERVKHPVKRIVPLSDERFSEAKLNGRPVQSLLDCEYNATQHAQSRKKDRLNSTQSGLDGPVAKADGPHSGKDSALDSAPEAQRKRKAVRKLKRRKDKEIRRAAKSDVPDILPTMSLEEPVHSSIMTAATNHLDPQAGLRLGGRHAVRQKYIRHKKMATMDSKAMNEILMVKG